MTYKVTVACAPHSCSPILRLMPLTCRAGEPRLQLRLPLAWPISMTRKSQSEGLTLSAAELPFLLIGLSFPHVATVSRKQVRT